MTLSGTPAAQARARAGWADLAGRLRSVGPGALGRGVIALAIVGFGTWLSFATWPTLLPFLVGALIAYAVLPIANRLDRVMPRVLAALLAELVALAVLVGVAVVVVPPLLRSIAAVALRLPTGDGVQTGLAALQAQLGDLPEPIRGILLSVLEETTANLSSAINGAVDGIGAFMTNQILGILGTATFLLGLLVIPVWVLTMVSDERAIKRRVVGAVAPAVRADFVATFRIVDRAMSTFLRIQVLMALVTTVLIWVGLEIARSLGIAEFPYALAGAVLLGSLQVIPQLGFLLGFIPVVLVFVLSGPVPAVTGLVVYVVAARIASQTIQSRASRGVLDVHAGLLIPAIVVLSEFGLIWLFAAAPVIAIARDLTRYAVGRLADPPRPAGVLPSDRVRSAAAPPAAAVKSVYRDRIASRPAAVPAAATRSTAL